MWRNLVLYSFQGICRENQRNNSSVCRKNCPPGKIYHLEKGGEIRGGVRGQNTGATVWRFCRIQAGLSERPTKRRRVEGQDTGVYTEQCVPAQHFHVPVLEVEGLVLDDDRGVVGRRLIVRSTCDRGVDGRLVIKSICDREVGQSGDADGRRLSDRRYGDHDIWLWGGARFEWRRLRDLGFEISVGKS
jgi:hypothetical protein